MLANGDAAHGIKPEARREKINDFSESTLAEGLES
jgi:hypothetical protein